MANEVESLVDGSQIETSDSGDWKLTLPNGRPVRGHANSQQAARQAAWQEHDQYVLRQWELGSPLRGQVWACPLG